MWSELAPLPTPLTNNAVTSVDLGDGRTVVYSFMGMVDPGDPDSITAASYALDVPGGAWRRIADAPLLNGKAKIGASAVTVAGEVYLIGGYTVGRFETTECRLFRYDGVADAYLERAEVPVEVDDTVAGVYVDRHIALVSGWHGPVNNNVPNVQVYDTYADVWTQATPILDPLPGLFGHAGTIINNRIIYADGVRTGGGFRISDRVFVGTIDPLGTGDVTRVDWTELPPHPRGPTYRAAASQGATAGGAMLLIGGTDNPYNFNGIGYNGIPSQPLGQVLSFDPESGRWRALRTDGPHVPTMDHRGLARVGFGWVTVGGMIAPRQATDRVFRLDLTPPPVAPAPVFRRVEPRP